MEEELKQIKLTFNDLKKEFAEGKINENPLAYVAGAFVGTGFFLTLERK